MGRQESFAQSYRCDSVGASFAGGFRREDRLVALMPPRDRFVFRVFVARRRNDDLLKRASQMLSKSPPFFRDLCFERVLRITMLDDSKWLFESIVVTTDRLPLSHPTQPGARRPISPAGGQRLATLRRSGCSPRRTFSTESTQTGSFRLMRRRWHYDAICPPQRAGVEEWPSARSFLPLGEPLP